MRLSVAVAILMLFFSGGAQAKDILGEISETDLRGHIEILASDDFGGRKPGTVGENKTVEYIATEWQKAGLQTGTGTNSWYAPVSLVDRTPLKQTFDFKYSNGKRTKTVRIDDDQIFLRGAMQFGTLSNAPVIHVGYGNRPVEEMEPIISGKLALMFLSSRPGAKDFPGYRERKANIIAAGASGILTVIRSESRFARTARRFRTASTSLDGKGKHANLEGLISGKAVDKLLRKAGIDPKKLFEDAKLEEFQPIMTGVYADLSAETQVRTYQSHNVIGKIAGRKPASGAVLFMGHWDHLGECRGEAEVDRICNGAVDNASGISLLIETAKRLTSSRLDRDIYFLATTAEESGLLGARAFAAQPSFTLDRLVAVFNADTVALAPDGKLIAVVGRGETDLDEDLEKVAAAHEREIDKSDKANAFIKRQDAYVFLEQDIPAFMITSAFSDQKRLDSYLESRYHDASDEVDEQLLLGGAADDANFHVALGRYFGNVDTYRKESDPNSAANSAGE
ncbi:MAG: M28 family peptidase [Parasphingorhabdus sp.]|uniref:M28 family peptidase n=1 Tax=Parasphingorhabdus sp. TaxID=2709688 RepID=UPI003297C648